MTFHFFTICPGCRKCLDIEISIYYLLTIKMAPSPLSKHLTNVIMQTPNNIIWPTWFILKQWNIHYLPTDKSLHYRYTERWIKGAAHHVPGAAWLWPSAGMTPVSVLLQPQSPRCPLHCTQGIWGYTTYIQSGFSNIGGWTSGQEEKIFYAICFWGHKYELWTLNKALARVSFCLSFHHVTEQSESQHLHFNFSPQCSTATPRWDNKMATRSI